MAVWTAGLEDKQARFSIYWEKLDSFLTIFKRSLEKLMSNN